MSDSVTGSPVVRVRDRDVTAEWCHIDNNPMGTRYAYHLSLADIRAIQREAVAEFIDTDMQVAIKARIDAFIRDELPGLVAGALDDSPWANPNADRVAAKIAELRK